MNIESDPNQAPPTWGVLYPQSSDFPFIELNKDGYSFGRGNNCDVIFDSSRLSCYSQYSKLHFTVHRQCDDVTRHYDVIITDFSRNGVYVNGIRIPQKTPFRLKSDVIISLCDVTRRAFHFVDVQSHINDVIFPAVMTDKYRSGELLGSGAFGQVYLAYSAQLRCRCAVKHVKHAGNARVKIEANILTQIRHPNIIGVLDIYEVPNAVFMVLEYAGGGDLLEFVTSRCPFSDLRAKFVAIQLLSAIRYLHGCDVTHRDVKLENMLAMTRNEFSVIKLTDFGLSRVVDDASLMTSLAGSPLYAAPEIVTGFQGNPVSYTSKVDLWGLGVSLFALLSSSFPFHPDRDVTMTLYDQILSGRWAFDRKWERTSPESRDFVSKLLLVNPKERLSASKALCHPWFNDVTLLEILNTFAPLTFE